MPLKLSALNSLILTVASISCLSGLPSAAQARPDAYTYSWSKIYDEGDLEACQKVGYITLAKNGYTKQLDETVRKKFISVYGWNDAKTLIAMINCDIDDPGGVEILIGTLTVAGSDMMDTSVFDAYERFSFD